MRTKIEIKNWLKDQYFYNNFYNNIIKENGELGSEDILEGKYDEDTFVVAFRYIDTPEGFRYWQSKEYRFLRWYNNDTSYYDILVNIYNKIYKKLKLWSLHFLTFL